MAIITLPPGRQRCLVHNETFLAGRGCPVCSALAAISLPRRSQPIKPSGLTISGLTRCLLHDETYFVAEGCSACAGRVSNHARRTEEAVLATYYGKAAQPWSEREEMIRRQKRGKLFRFTRTVVAFPKLASKAMVRIESLSICGDYFDCIAIRGFPSHRGDSFKLDSSIVESLGVIVENLLTSAVLYAPPARRPQPEDRPQIVVDIDW